MKILGAVKNLVANLRTLTATRIPEPQPGPPLLTGQQLLAWMIERWLRSPGVELPDGRRCVLTDNDREFLRRMLLVTLATGHRQPPQVVRPAPVPTQAVQSAPAPVPPQLEPTAPVPADAAGEPGQ